MIAELPLGFRAKLSRASEHLNVFKVATAPFSGEGKAYSIDKSVDSEAGEFVFRLRTHREPDIVGWSLVIGDCIHNARAALDHLFFALVAKQNPSGVTGSTSTMHFPILKEGATFKGRKVKLKNWVGSAALAKIEELQPFNDARGWNRNTLSFVHDFDIMDKHKLLLPAVSIADSARISADTVEDREIVFDGGITFRLDGLKEGAELARLRVRNPEDVVDMNVYLTFQVIFEAQPGPLVVTKCLEDVIAGVEATGSEFLAFL